MSSRGDLLDMISYSQKYAIIVKRRKKRERAIVSFASCGRFIKVSIMIFP
jgi:hypothetical protein